jgi:hypothetical protein
VATESVPETVENFLSVELFSAQADYIVSWIFLSVVKKNHVKPNK